MGLSTLLDSVATWVQEIIRAMGYPGLALVMFLENILPPIPSEVVLPMAGWLAFEGQDNFTLLGVTLIGGVGSVSGALVFYGLGYAFGEDRVRSLLESYGKWLLLKVEDFDTAIDWFDRYGELVVFFGRMVPIVRSLVSIPAGIARMNLLRFSVYTAIGTSLWSFLLALAGFHLGKNWTLVTEWVGRYEKVVLLLTIAGLVVFVARRLRHRSVREEPQAHKG